MDWFEIRIHPARRLGASCSAMCAKTRAASSAASSARRNWPPQASLLPVAQINHTRTSRRGAVRGLHFQRPPHAEDKFVSCLRGEVFDVAVDLRRGSPTFLRWHARSPVGRQPPSAC